MEYEKYVYYHPKLNVIAYSSKYVRKVYQTYDGLEIIYDWNRTWIKLGVF